MSRDFFLASVAFGNAIPVERLAARWSVLGCGELMNEKERRKIEGRSSRERLGT